MIRRLKQPTFHLALFGVTVLSVLATAFYGDPAFEHAFGPARDGVKLREALSHAAEFTGTLLGILLAHEFGHYFAARYHRVDASLPYFIPLPILSPFGTMGAVIRMQGSIARRAALLDIGASGPLAGLVFAIPLYAWGVRHSKIVERETVHGLQLGESILLKALDRLSMGAVPPNMEIELSPMAYAAWAGMFVTMINLLPVGQLDGGHVAYALFGKKQDRFARFVHRLAIGVFAVALARPVLGDLLAGKGVGAFGHHAESALFWLVWFLMLPILGAMSRRGAPLPGDDSSDDSARDATSQTETQTRLALRERVGMLVGLMVAAGVLSSQSARVSFAGWVVLLGGLFVVERTRGTLRNHDTFDHPPTDEGPLDGVRYVIGIITLVFFILLFMPAPMTPI